MTVSAASSSEIKSRQSEAKGLREITADLPPDDRLPIMPSGDKSCIAAVAKQEPAPDHGAFLAVTVAW